MGKGEGGVASEFGNGEDSGRGRDRRCLGEEKTREEDTEQRGGDVNASDDSLEGVAQSPQRGLALWQLAASASPQHQAPGADGHARLTDLGTSPSTPAPLLSSSAPSVHTPPGSVTAGAPPRASLLRTSAASSPSAALPSCRALIIPSHMWGVGSLLPAHMWGVGSLVPVHTHTHTHTHTHFMLHNYSLNATAAASRNTPAAVC